MSQRDVEDIIREVNDLKSRVAKLRPGGKLKGPKSSAIRVSVPKGIKAEDASRLCASVLDGVAGNLYHLHKAGRVKKVPGGFWEATTATDDAAQTSIQAQDNGSESNQGVAVAPVNGFTEARQEIQSGEPVPTTTATAPAWESWNQSRNIDTEPRERAVLKRHLKDRGPLPAFAIAQGTSLPTAMARKLLAKARLHRELRLTPEGYTAP